MSSYTYTSPFNDELLALEEADYLAVTTGQTIALVDIDGIRLGVMPLKDARRNGCRILEFITASNCQLAI